MTPDMGLHTDHPDLAEVTAWVDVDTHLRRSNPWGDVSQTYVQTAIRVTPR